MPTKIPDGLATPKPKTEDEKVTRYVKKLSAAALRKLITEPHTGERAKKVINDALAREAARQSKQ